LFLKIARIAGRPARRAVKGASAGAGKVTGLILRGRDRCPAADGRAAVSTSQRLIDESPPSGSRTPDRRAWKVIANNAGGEFDSCGCLGPLPSWVRVATTVAAHVAIAVVDDGPLKKSRVVFHPDTLVSSNERSSV
jgi:hypothetical protein